MFSTQLSGLFKRLQEHEEHSIEDGARLLAQATAGEGVVYVYGTKEMGGIPLEALEGAEPLKGAALLKAEQIADLTVADRVLLFTRSSTDPEGLSLAQKLIEKDIPFVSVSTVENDVQNTEGMESLADVNIDLKLTKGLLPTETGERIGFPTSMAALFVYYGLKFTIEEMIAEYDE